MPVTAEALNALLPANDRGDFAEFEFDDRIERFTGHIVHHEFRGLSVPERQDWIWRRLREEFGDEASQVSLVLTFSPEEWAEVGSEAA